MKGQGKYVMVNKNCGEALSKLKDRGFQATNKNIKISSFKSSRNIQKKEDGPDSSVSDNQSSSVTLNELSMKIRKNTVISSFSKEVIH